MRSFIGLNLLAKLRRHLYWLLVPLLLAGCARAQGDVEGPVYPFVLAPEEIRQARHLAEEHLGIDPRPASPREKVCFIKAELLPDAQAETSQRHVMVTHYRYLDDETIHTMVDLVRHQIVKFEKFHQFPTALSPEEIQRTEELARGDDRLKPLLQDGGIAVRLQPRPIQFSQPSEFFGHRVVEVQLLRGNHYLRSPRVRIDLHTEIVYLDVPHETNSKLK